MGRGADWGTLMVVAWLCSRAWVRHFQAFLKRFLNYIAEAEVLHIQIEARKNGIQVLTITMNPASLTGKV